MTGNATGRPQVTGAQGAPRGARPARGDADPRRRALHPDPTLLEIAHRLLYRPELAGRGGPARREPAAWLATLRALPEKELELPDTGQLAAQAEACRRQGIRATWYGAPDYPPDLFDLDQPPPVLFYRGRLPAPGERRVAIVGSRRASLPGRDFARDLGAGAAAAGVPVVSGLARGVDQAAHRGCLEQGPTWAIMGGGLDAVYPPEAARLAEAVVEKGGLLGEFPPGVPPLPFHFPRRNRIIAALARALVVVEAGARSGALSTAREALALGRELGVAPSNPLNPMAAGSNRLLAEGAAVILAPEDLLALLGVRGSSAATGEPWTAHRCARENVTDLETLATRAGWLLTEALEALAAWEREGLVLRLPGGCFRPLPGDGDAPPARELNVGVSDGDEAEAVAPNAGARRDGA